MTVQAEKRRIFASGVWKGLFCFCIILPIVALFVVLRGYPIVNTFLLSFRKWDMLSASKPWVGFRNYAKLLFSPQFLEALKNTTIYSLLFVPTVTGLSLFLAILINRPKMKRFVSIYQFVYFIPVVCSIIPSAILWRWIFDAQYGLLNYFLSLLGLPRIQWLMDYPTVLYSIVIFSVWKNVGYYLVIFFVGLKAIPTLYYEAARIDGANNLQILTKITMPLLKPIILLVLVLSTIAAYNVFAVAYVLATETGSTIARVLVYEIYQQAFLFFKMGYAAAEAVVMLAVVSLLTFLLFAASKKRARETSKGG